MRELLAAGAATQEELLDIDRWVTARIVEAADFAVNSPLPEPETAFQGVFA